MTTLRELARELERAGREIGDTLSSLILDTDLGSAVVVIGYAALSAIAVAVAYAGVMGYVHFVADARTNWPVFKDEVAGFVALLIVAGGIVGAILIGAAAGGYAALAVIGATGLLLAVLAKRGRRTGLTKLS